MKVYEKVKCNEINSLGVLFHTLSYTFIHFSYGRAKVYEMYERSIRLSYIHTAPEFESQSRRRLRCRLAV